MLYWAVVFLIISIVAGIFGFGRISEASAGIAKLLFGIALILFLLFLLIGMQVIHWAT